jgi:hypothetical protein
VYTILYRFGAGERDGEKEKSCHLHFGFGAQCFMQKAMEMRDPVRVNVLGTAGSWVSTKDASVFPTVTSLPHPSPKPFRPAQIRHPSIPKPKLHIFYLKIDDAMSKHTSILHECWLCFASVAPHVEQFMHVQRGKEKETL